MTAPVSRDKRLSRKTRQGRSGAVGRRGNRKRTGGVGETCRKSTPRPSSGVGRHEVIQGGRASITAGSPDVETKFRNSGAGVVFLCQGGGCGVWVFGILDIYRTEEHTSELKSL